MFHFGNYAVPSWHHLQIQIGRWNGTTFFTNGIFGFKIWHLQLRSNHCHTFFKLNRVKATLGPVLLCGAVARTSLGTSHIGVESGHQSSTGRSARHTWDQKVAAFCRHKELGHWMEYAQDQKTIKKHGWHFLTLSTTFARPKVKRFVNTDL